MGKVATVFKVYIEGGKDAEVGKAIVKAMKPSGIQTEDVAFGIKVLKVMFVHEDEDGSTSYEEGLRKIKGVTEVEIEGESLL